MLLGGHKAGKGYLCRCPIPGHGKGQGDRNPSLSIADGNERLLVRCHSGCDPRDVIAELRRRGLLEDGDGFRSGMKIRTREQGYPPAAKIEPAHDPNPQALAIWRSGQPITGSIAERFIRARGIALELTPSLRSGAHPYIGPYESPVSIAAVQAPARQVIAVQVTLIDPRGDRKAQVRLPRKTIGALGWGAIRLAAATDELALAEGTEKGLAAMQLFGVPCWSSLGAGRMHRVWIPDDVRTLHIFADNDEPGRVAAERTAHAHRHRRVVLHFPPDGCKDWDDVTTARAKEQGAVA